MTEDFYCEKCGKRYPTPCKMTAQQHQFQSGLRRLEFLSQAANSHGDYDRAHREFDWWLRFASEKNINKLKQHSPYAHDVVAERMRDLRTAGLL